MVFQWFPMVANHWSDNGMVTIHRSGLTAPLPLKMSAVCILLVHHNDFVKGWEGLLGEEWLLKLGRSNFS